MNNKLHLQRAAHTNKASRSKRNKVGSVVFPGDTMSVKEATGGFGKTRIGIGLTPSVVKQSDEKTSEAILVTRAGILKSRYSKPPKLWVTSRQRRVQSVFEIQMFWINCFCLRIVSLNCC